MDKRERAYRKTNGRCYYCGERLNGVFELDHIIPKSAGGYGLDNYAACCSDCNSMKGVLSVEQFRRYLEEGIFDKFHGRMIKKYYGIRRRHIKFYFEKVGEKNGKV